MSRRAADSVTGLTPQQEKFCIELVRTGNASEAYRLAYPKQNMKPDSLAVKACRLAGTDKIRIRLSDLRSSVRRNSGITLTEHLVTLEELRQEARAAMQYSAAITAETARGKVSGLYEEGGNDDDAPAVQRVEIVIKDGRKA